MPVLAGQKPQVISRRPLDGQEAEWKRLVKTTYVDPNGTQRSWESAELQTRVEGAQIDGVGVLSIFDRPTGPEILLMKQYRPALDKVVIEFPGGLIDPGESPEQAAVRELKEETGYVGVVDRIGNVLYNSPGFCSNSFKVVYVHVDLSLPENQHPRPLLEDDEFIESFTAPLASLYPEIKRLEKEGFVIETRVVAMAEGIELARKWQL